MGRLIDVWRVEVMTKQVINQVEEREESALRQVRNAIVGYYANNAVEVFRSFVDLTDEEFAEFMRVTENGSVVFTIPSDAVLEADKQSECPRFTVGRKFGSIQWYKKTQVVGTALALLTSYSSFVRYMDSKENAVQRDEKKLAAAAAVLGVSVEMLKALQKK